MVLLGQGFQDMFAGRKTPFAEQAGQELATAVNILIRQATGKDVR